MVLMAFGETSHAWLHNTQSLAFFNVRSSRWGRWLSSIRDEIADRWLFGTYSLLVTPSQSSALEMLGRIRGNKRPKSGHLYPAIGDLPTPNQNSEAEDGGSCGPIDLWMIGRIEYGHKNNLVALDVLETLHSAGKDANLTVLGDGPDLADFKLQSSMRGVAKRIRFLGWKTDPWKTVPRDALVFIPSLYESMSLVAREAMIRGICLVCSPIPVFQEWIPIRLIADSFSAQAFADKIIDVQSLKKEELLEIYSVALTKFSDDIFVRQFMAFTALE
jgi:glycosyltransferase involved in cell wall biosynthesis